MVTTSNYLANLDREQFGTHFSKNLLNRYCRFVHTHPTATKVIQIAAMILGAALIVASFFVPPAIGVVLGILGAVSLATGGLAYKYSNFLTTPHDMSNHIFRPGKLHHCELRYCNDVPIFTIENEDPRLAGYAHGFLMAPQIQLIRKNFNEILHGVARRPRPDDLSDMIAEVRKKIPQKYLDELKGLVDGFNNWAQNDFSIPLLTENEMILFHLLPDSVHFKPMRQIQEKPAAAPAPAPVPVPSGGVACSAIAARGILGRNLDWPTMGIAGATSAVFVRKIAGQEPIVEVGFAGFIGTLTGMKGKLRLAMNICDGETTKIEGMPAAFLNRQCLEECDTIDEVEEHLENNASLGPYHITTADENGARAFHLMQDDQGKKARVREYVDGESPLIVTNCRYKANDEQESHRSCSLQREGVLREFFNDAQAKTVDQNLEELIPVALSLPFVDNWESAHRIIMENDGSLSVSFDNGFAGSAPLRKLTQEQWMGG